MLNVLITKGIIIREMEKTFASDLCYDDVISIFLSPDSSSGVHCVRLFV